MAFSIVLNILLALLLIRSFNQDDKKQTQQDTAIANEKEITNEKTRYLAKVSHDLRTPLHGINGLIQIIQAEKLSAKVSRYLDHMRVSTDSLLHVISDVIDLSYSQNHTLELNNESFQLLTVCENLIKMFAQSSQAKNIDLQLHFDPKLSDSYVCSDSQRLYKVLNNLLGNAFKFTDNGTVALWVVFRRSNTEELEVRFIISDTGIGMSQNDADAIFQDFYQVTDAQQGRLNGSGLGLKITNELVDLLGGKIKVSSKLNFGTQFEFDLVFKKSKTPNETTYRYNQSSDAVAVLVSQKGTSSETMLLYLSELNINTIHYENCETAMSVNSVNSSSLLIVEFDAVSGFDEANSIANHFQSQSKCLVIKDSQSREYEDWRLLYKPILPSEIKKLCLYAKLILPVVSYSNQQVDYVSLLNEIVKDHAHLNMLIVDDIEINQIVLRELLKQLGFTNIQLAINGVEAIEKAQANSFDMVWMDIMMPGMSGIEASIELRNQGYIGKIYGLTAMVDNELSESCSKAMNAVLSKPISLEQLAKHIYSDVFDDGINKSNAPILLESLEKTAKASQKYLPINILVASDNEATKSLFVRLFALSDSYSLSFVSVASDIPIALQKVPYHLFIVDTALNRLSMDMLLYDLTQKRINLPMLAFVDETAKKPQTWSRVFNISKKPCTPSSICNAIKNIMVREVRINGPHQPSQLKENAEFKQDE